MATPEAHFKQLLDWLSEFVTEEMKVSIAKLQIGHSLHVAATITHGPVTVQREVVLTDINHRDTFKVTMTEQTVGPSYVLKTFERSFHSTNCYVATDQWISQIRYFLFSAVEIDKIPTPDQINKVLEINKDYLNGGYSVELYLSSGDFGDDWVHRIVDNNKKVICDHLLAERADGHTYRLIVNTFTLGFNAGIAEGVARVVEETTREMAHKVIGLIPDRQDRYDSPLAHITRADNPPIFQRK